MTIRKQHLAGTVAMLGVLVGFAIVPRPALAQWGTTGGGGGHDHSRNEPAAKAPAADRKLQKSIDLLLGDKRGRALLEDALLADREFMRSFIKLLTGIPEWRALAAQGLKATPMGGGSPARPADARPAVQYACPMHPDVTSSTAGQCPKCGMKLERAAAAGK
jgi:hypothetical protein